MAVNTNDSWEIRENNVNALIYDFLFYVTGYRSK